MNSWAATYEETVVATQSLKSMSVMALLKLRDDISTILSRRTEAVKQELRSLGEDYAHVGRIAVYGKKNAAKRRAEAKRVAKGSGDAAAAQTAKKVAKKATKKAKRASKRLSPASSAKKRKAARRR